MIPMLLVISLIVFLGLRATGIDPITYMVSMEVQAQSPEIVEQLYREQLESIYRSAQQRAGLSHTEQIKSVKGSCTSNV